MRIDSVDPFLTYSYLLVRIRTDTGLTGWGQPCYFPDSLAAERVVTRLRDYLVGKDPLEIERHWMHMFRSSAFRTSEVMAAISAIDIALWDIAGKHFEAPIYQLLGGKQRDKVRLHYLMDDPHRPSATVDDLVEKAQEAVREGFTAVKGDMLPLDYAHLSFSRLVEEVVKRVGAVRETIGPDIDLGLELHRKLVPSEAIVLAQHLEPFRLLFYEDPIVPNSVDAQVQVTRNIRIPVAYGERCLNIFDFRDLLTRDGVHYLRPDVGTVGGISQFKKIATLGEAFHVGIVPHNFISPLLTAATTQVDMAISNWTMQEHTLVDEEPPRSEMLKTTLKREGGYMIPPEAPGLGVELNEEFLTKYPFEPMKPEVPLHLDGSVAIH